MKSNVQTHEKFISLFPEHWMNAGKAEQEISLRIYQLLAKKIHPNEELLAAELPYSVEEIQGILEPLKAGIYRAEGNIIGFAGLTTHPMAHSIKIDGTTTASAVRLYLVCTGCPLHPGTAGQAGFRNFQGSSY